MFLWNIGAIGWLIHVKQGIPALLINSIIYTLPFVTYYILKNRLNSWSFIPIWLIFELIINSFSFPTPLLTIGNSMGNQMYFVQWYRYTSVVGGSFWFLLIAYYIWLNKKGLYAILIIPMILSLLLFFKKNINTNKDTFITNVTVFDNENFRKKKKTNIISYLNIKNKILFGTDFFIMPESTIFIDSKNYSNTLIFKSLEAFRKQQHIKYLIFGSMISITKNTKINTSITISNQKNYLTVKQKLVPFDEYKPKILRRIQDNNTTISNINDNLNEIIDDISITPLICYDAFFPFYVSEVSKKSKIIILLSSEAFLNGSYFGKKHFNSICKIRSVENNMPFLKCSNSGKSLLINNKGTIIDDSQDNEFYTFKIPIHLLNYETK